MELLIIIGVVGAIAYFVGEASGNKNTSQSTYQKPTPSPRLQPKPKLNIKQVDISSITLSDEQANIFNLIETTNDNYYITGKAGTGKSILLQYFVENSGKRPCNDRA